MRQVVLVFMLLGGLLLALVIWVSAGLAMLGLDRAAWWARAVMVVIAAVTLPSFLWQNRRQLHRLGLRGQS